MSMRWRALRGVVTAASAVVALAGAPRPARALFENVGRNSVEQLKPILAGALADADTRLTKAEDHLGVIGHGLLDQEKQILSDRIVQLKDVTNEATDHAVARLDVLAKTTLADAKKLGVQLIDHANAGIKGDITQLGQEIDGAVAKADQALAARVDQLDEVATRQLGNVDVIASKQQIALEQTAVHIAVVVGIVVFIVFALRRLWDIYVAAKSPDASANAKQARDLGGKLAVELAAAGIAVGALFLLYDRLPFGARKAEAALVATQEQALKEAFQRFDFTKVRFHASQLQYLRPAQAGWYQGQEMKADLLRDILARPTLLATEPGLTQISDRVASARRLLGPTPDPDLLVVEAMVVWERGATRRDEQRAASLCARAIRLGQATDGFTLAPLARTYIDTFLEAPYQDKVAGVGRDSETPADLRVISNGGGGEGDSPLSATLVVARLMREVDARSSSAYAAMIQAHAALDGLSRGDGKPAQIAAQRAARKAAATAVVKAWTDFDGALVAMPELANSTAVLAIFRLDDSQYTRAKWFLSRSDGETRVAPLLSSVSAAGKSGRAPAAKSGQAPSSCAATLSDGDEAAMRLVLAPPRVVWARRYHRLFAGPARAAFEQQEANRFEAGERLAQKLECDLVAAAESATPDRQQAAALDAAQLGLYVGDGSNGGPRTAFAEKLLPTGGDARFEDALAARGVRLF
jgi:hypothetical protein